MIHRTAAARGVVLAILLIPLLLPASALAAGDHGFQIEVSGMLAKPFGAYSNGDKASDLYDLGGRFGTKLMFGMSRGFYVGAWVAYLKNQRDFAITESVGSGASADVSGTRSLSAIPVEALFQLRNDTRRRMSGYVEGGAGITTYTRRASELLAVITFDPKQGLPPDTVGLQPISEVQQAFSFHFGAGAVLGLNRDWEVVAGLTYQQSIVRGGEAWNADDDPKYALLSLGVRYPRW